MDDCCKRFEVRRETSIGLDPCESALDDPSLLANEAGQFIEAVRTQEQAIELLKAQGKEERLSDYESRLKLYQKNEPFRSQPQTGANQ